MDDFNKEVDKMLLSPYLHELTLRAFMERRHDLLIRAVGMLEDRHDYRHENNA